MIKALIVIFLVLVLILEIVFEIEITFDFSIKKLNQMLFSLALTIVMVIAIYYLLK